MDIRNLFLGDFDDEINKLASKEKDNKKEYEYYTFGESEQKEYENIEFEDLIREYKKDVLRGMSDENLASVHLEVVKNIGLSNYERYFDEYQDSLKLVKKNKEKVIDEIMKNIQDEFLLKRASIDKKNLWKIVNIDGKDYIIRTTKEDLEDPSEATRILSSLGITNNLMEIESKMTDVSEKINDFFNSFEFKYAFKNGLKEIAKVAYYYFKDDELVLSNLPIKFFKNYGSFNFI